MNKTNITLGIAVLALIVAGMGLVGGGSSNQSVGGTRFPNGLSADSTSPSSGEVRGTTLTITGAQTLSGATSLSSTLSVSGLATLNGGQLRSNTNSTSTTATSVTMVESDIEDYDTVLMTPNTGALTLTFPATSTITSMIPTAGDMAQQCWYNATSTAAASITFAAGTGIDLEVASSSAAAALDANLTIPAQGYGCFNYVRETDTDIGVLFTPYVNAD